ncbi:fermitin family homolog 3, partial [Lates japonicus]
MRSDRGTGVPPVSTSQNLGQRRLTTCLLYFSPSFSSSLSPSMAAWDLSVTVEDLGPDAPPVTLSVTSDLHVGGVILKLVEKTHIRHPEELSLLRPLEEKKKKKDKDSTVEIYDLTEVPLSSVSRPCLYNGMPAHFADSPQMEAIYKMLSVTQPPPAPEVIAKQYRPASVVDKAHING